MTVLSVDASEVEAWGRHMVTYADQVEARAELAVTKTAYDVEASAKMYAPVDTGNLRNAISTDIYGLEAEVGPTAEYGPAVEHGSGIHGETGQPYPIPNAFGRGDTVMHPGIRPQPYMAPAAARHTPGFEKAITSLGEGIARGRRGS